MNARFSLKDFGHAIHPQDVIGYLAKRDWRIEHDEENSRIRFEGPLDDEGNPIVLFLPASEAYRDYPLRVEDLIGALTVIQGLPAVEIVTEMVNTGDRGGPSPKGPGTGDPEEILRKGFASASNLFPPEKAKGLIEELQPLLTNLELTDQQAPDAEIWRAATLVVVRIARHLPRGAEAKLFLWSIFEKLLAPIHSRLEWSSSQVEEFFSRAVSADVGAPDALWEWILDNTKPVTIKPRRATTDVLNHDAE